MLSLSLVFISFSISFSLYCGMQQTKGGGGVAGEFWNLLCQCQCKASPPGSGRDIGTVWDCLVYPCHVVQAAIFHWETEKLRVLIGMDRSKKKKINQLINYSMKQLFHHLNQPIA